MFRYTMNIAGRFEYDDYGDPATVTVDGSYDVSTIVVRTGMQTVLFKRAGAGPRQLELWHWQDAPDESTVREELAAGRFQAFGVDG